MSGSECIDKVLAGNKYDIIFMDIMMPKMNGVETLNNLKSIVGFSMPVVALTADVIAGMEDKYISQGFDDCLPKPIIEEQLYYMLRKFLKESTAITQSIPIVVQTPQNPTPTNENTTSLELPIAAQQAIEEKQPEIELPIAAQQAIEEKQPEIELPQIAEQPIEIPTPTVEEISVTEQNPNVQIIPGEPHTVELLKNNKIDVDAGIELLKDMEMYDMTLEEFYNELQNKLTDLENYKNEGNMEDYAILAHALKTEARYVGCTVLGDLAYEHELAGKESNQELINQKFAELKQEANRIYEVVKTYFGN
jgi:CheY-like chemotaxis protein/HPt (histidine-containing phosphotransfer) domain-containing protein